MAGILEGVILGLSVAIPLGPCSVAIITAGLRAGFLRALLTAAGVALADTTYMLAVYFGVSRLVQTPSIRALILGLGASVLIYMGCRSVRNGGRSVELQTAAESASMNPLLAGFLVNISNPIAAVWWVTVFGSLLGEAEGTARWSAVVDGAAILGGILLWHSIVALLTRWWKGIVNERATRYLSIVGGAALILFGLKFAYDAVCILVADRLGA